MSDKEIVPDIEKDPVGARMNFISAAIQDIALRYTGLEEAPFSVNFRAIHPDGWGMQFTVRDHNGIDGLKKMDATLKGLVKRGFTPNGGYTAPAPQAAQPTPGVTGVNPAWCDIHKVEMKLNTNERGSWYSHKVGETWCKGK
jgi:hypothetical protein